MTDSQRVDRVVLLVDIIPSTDVVASSTALMLRYAAQRWTKWGGPPDANAVTTADCVAVRAAGERAGAAPVTIEDTISRVVTLCKTVGHVVDPGRRLRLRVKLKPVPLLADLAKLYAVADQCRYPMRLRNGDYTWRDIPAELRADWLRGLLVLGLWTGLRLQDLLQLDWDAVTPDRIVWQASKTSREHRFPMSPVVWRHLAPLREFGRSTVLAVNHTNTTLIRNELDRLCGIAGIQSAIGPQAIRRASITTWATLGVGHVIHGCGLPRVLQHYVDGEQLLKAQSDRFPWPVEMLPPELRDTRQRLGSEVQDVLARLSPQRMQDVLRVARAFVG